MTQYVDPADVDSLIAAVGFHVRERNLLMSALAAPLPVFGEEIYLGLNSKAAALIIAINRNHPLIDGNKRLSWLVTKAFLALNGRHLAVGSVREGDKFVRSVADDRCSFNDVVRWIETHTTPL